MKKIYHLHGPAPLYTNTFLLITDAGSGVIVDPAAPAGDYRRLLEQEGAKLTHIFLTHGHFDHIDSLNELHTGGVQLWMAPGDVKMFASRAAAVCTFGPAAAELYRELEGGGLGFEPDGLFADGGTVKVDEAEFTVWFTPGHTKGSCCILLDGLLFSGDTLFCGGAGRTDFPGGSRQELLQSMAKLKRVVPDETAVLPGHEDFTTMKREKETNEALRMA